VILPLNKIFAQLIKEFWIYECLDLKMSNAKAGKRSAFPLALRFISITA